MPDFDAGFDTSLLQYEFFRPLVTGWLSKIEAAERYRAKWKEIADECHDDKTEVLTDDGWRLFRDLVGDELLGTVNLDTDSIEFQKPSQITARPSSGEMVRFSGKSLDALVTPGHRMVYFPPHSQAVGMKEVKDLLRSDQLKLTAENWHGVTPQLPEFLGGVNPSDFAEWLGFYIAEGWCANYAASKSKSPTYPVGIAQKKLHGCKYYEALSARMPFRTPPYQAKCGQYIFSNKELWHYLKPLGNCYQKYVPQWVKDAPQNVIKAFLKGYLAGDGHVARGITVSATASKRLADDIQELWLKAGRSASIRERQPAPYSFAEPDGESRNGMSGKLYLVTAWKAGKRASLKWRTDSKVELKYWKEAYDGMVYCATVPNGTLITRRNGLPLISGNCKMFYGRSAAAMWDASYTRKFWKGVPTPRFRMTLNKAFEFVAIVGPNLLWDVPHRTVEPKKSVELPPEIFGDLNDPQVKQIYDQAMQEYGQERGVDKAIAGLLYAWLNYTARETPGGGLEGQSELAVMDAMLTGRGVLCVRPYSMASSKRTLTGAFREPPDHLYIDPDFNHIDDARWIAIKHRSPTWEVERRFGWPKGSLKGKASLESLTARGEGAGDDWRNTERGSGQTNDLMVYYEIFSKTGCGARLTGMDTIVKEHLESTVGDFAYLVVAPNVPCPLNCPTEKLRQGASSEQVKQMFSWPIPYWADDDWPVALLDFYQDTDHSWPIAPLAPGLGELKFLNVMFSHVCNRIWSSSRDFIAVAQSAFSDLEKYLK
jgi:hypothetical protein